MHRQSLNTSILAFKHEHKASYRQLFDLALNIFVPLANSPPSIEPFLQKPDKHSFIIITAFHNSFSHVWHYIEDTILAYSVNTVRVGAVAGDVPIESCHSHIDDVERRFEAVHIEVVAQFRGDECYFLHVLIFSYQLMDWEVYQTEVSVQILDIRIIWISSDKCERFCV